MAEKARKRNDAVVKIIIQLQTTADTGDTPALPDDSLVEDVIQKLTTAVEISLAFGRVTHILRRTKTLYFNKATVDKVRDNLFALVVGDERAQGCS